MCKDRVRSPPYHLKEKDTIMKRFRKDSWEEPSRASSSKSEHFDYTRRAFTRLQSQRADDTTTAKYLGMAASGENVGSAQPSTAEQYLAPPTASDRYQPSTAEQYLAPPTASNMYQPSTAGLYSTSPRVSDMYQSSTVEQYLAPPTASNMYQPSTAGLYSTSPRVSDMYQSSTAEQYLAPPTVQEISSMEAYRRSPRAYDTTAAGYPMTAASGKNYANAPLSQAQITELYQRAYDATAAGYPMTAASGEYSGSTLLPPAQITELYSTSPRVSDTTAAEYLTAARSAQPSTAHAELDLELRLGLPQVDSASPRNQNKQKQAEFAQKNKPLELNRDGPEELVLREFTCDNYNMATKNIKKHIYKIQNYKGTGRYGMKELTDSLTNFGQFHPKKIKDSNIHIQDIYKRLQEIIENPSNSPEKSAAELLVYYITRKD
jgi:hypothetical protein